MDTMVVDLRKPCSTVSRPLLLLGSSMYQGCVCFFGIEGRQKKQMSDMYAELPLVVLDN